MTLATIEAGSQSIFRQWGPLLLWLGSPFIAATPGARPSAPPDIFAAQPVWKIQIELGADQIESLRREGRKYVPARIRVMGQTLDAVGVRLKGSTGSFRGIDDRPGFTVDFGKFNDQRFQGLQKIHLNNSVEDSTTIKDQLGSELFRRAGLPVPRFAHAWVELNGRSLGLYVLKEGFTEQFIERYFGQADGNLYDTDRGHDVDAPMKQQWGSDSGDQQMELRELAEAASDPDLARRWERLAARLDVDRFLTFMAMEIMIGHWDGYCLAQNNFRIYFDKATGKAVFLPTGMDQLFSKADLPWRPAMAGLVARAIMETPEGRERYAAAFKARFEALFVPERICRRVDELLNDLRPFLKGAVFRRMRQDAEELRGQIHARAANLLAQLSEPDPALPDFARGKALLAAWKGAEEMGGGMMREFETPQGEMVLHTLAGARTSAAWRSSVRLRPGYYRFEGKARVTGVTRLPFGKSQGASLRVAGSGQRSAELTGNTAWQRLAVDFAVEAGEQEIQLLCELRASGGEAWFEKSSLSLVCLGEKMPPE